MSFLIGHSDHEVAIHIKWGILAGFQHLEGQEIGVTTAGRNAKLGRQQAE
jgi:hypothetical protein